MNTLGSLGIESHQLLGLHFDALHFSVHCRVTSDHYYNTNFYQCGEL